MNKIFTIILSISIAAIGAACGHSETNHNTVDHSKMDHSTMDHSTMKSAPDAAKAPYDLQFIDTMITHHQGAVEMAKMVEGKTQNAEIVKFAAQITADQEKEINQLKTWRDEWFKDKPSAQNMEMSGMADSMKMDMSKLTGSKDRDFDLAFVEMMTPHHVGAVLMAKEALQKSEKAEIKTLAEQIIKAQEAEIKMMEKWKTDWSK